MKRTYTQVKGLEQRILEFPQPESAAQINTAKMAVNVCLDMCILSCLAHILPWVVLFCKQGIIHFYKYLVFVEKLLLTNLEIVV